jgi:lauroyl/myristoyl acyltransferase
MLQNARRTVTRKIVEQVLSVSGRVPPRMTAALTTAVASTGRLCLRSRLRAVLRSALGTDFIPAADTYFRYLGRWAEVSLGVYHRGLERAGVTDWLTLADSVEHLDAAVRGERGVLLATPHLFTHELAAGVISRRHRVTALVREASHPRKEAVKRRWYEALGLETVSLPRDASHARAVARCRDVLRGGGILGITPDLMVPEGQGTAVDFCGQRVTVNPGLVVLAMMTGAPIVTCFGIPASAHGGSVEFSAPRTVAPSARRLPGERDREIQGAMQDWFGDFEAYLRRHPAMWMFWLDKRWSRTFLSARGKEAASTP